MNDLHLALLGKEEGPEMMQLSITSGRLLVKGDQSTNGGGLLVGMLEGKGKLMEP
jgi:hypothetical protein